MVRLLELGSEKDAVGGGGGAERWGGARSGKTSGSF